MGVAERSSALEDEEVMSLHPLTLMDRTKGKKDRE
jgi:hypothetical protein